jgi:hypothetical protein
MGYFQTLSDAERWVEAIRGRYPDAMATIAPTADSPPAAQSLTDTQVLRILDGRRASPEQAEGDAQACDQIGLLRPEDTSTREALKEAVVQGAPVPFAIQLQWSAEPIDLSHLPPLAVFKAYTLYAIESRREGRSRYFLRMGFFGDPVSAKQVAAQVRSNFSSAAVVPVTEQEVTRAREASGGGSSIPHLVQERVAPAVPTEPDPSGVVPRRAPRRETLEQTLKRLAERELWTDPDSLSESGVRHLKVEVQTNTSGRSHTSGRS